MDKFGYAKKPRTVNKPALAPVPSPISHPEDTLYTFPHSLCHALLDISEYFALVELSLMHLPVHIPNQLTCSIRFMKPWALGDVRCCLQLLDIRMFQASTCTVQLIRYHLGVVISSLGESSLCGDCVHLVAYEFKLGSSVRIISRVVICYLHQKLSLQRDSNFFLVPHSTVKEAGYCRSRFELGHKVGFALRSLQWR